MIKKILVIVVILAGMYYSACGISGGCAMIENTLDHPYLSSIIIILACFGITMSVGIYKDKFFQDQQERYVRYGSIIGVISIIAFWIIVPWFDVIMSYPDKWVSILLTLAIVGILFVMWKIFSRIMSFFEDSVKDATEKHRLTNLGYVDSLKTVLDEKKKEIATSVESKLNSHIDTVKKLNDISTIKDTIHEERGWTNKKINDTRVEIASQIRGIRDKISANAIETKNLKEDLTSNINELKKNIETIKDSTEKIQDVSSEIEDMKKRLANIEANIDKSTGLCISADEPEDSQHYTISADVQDMQTSDSNEYADQVCMQLKHHGFHVVRRQDNSQPDIVLYDKNKNPVAPILVRSREVDRDNIPRIARKSCTLGLEFAKRHGMPLILVVINTKTGRQWIFIVESENVGSWKSVTIPDFLASDDKDTIYQKYRDAIRRLEAMSDT